MEITVNEHVVRVHRLTLNGRFDAFTVPNFRQEQERLLTDGGKYFVVDLRLVSFMDSAAMSALVSLLKRGRQAGGDVVLIAPTEASAYRILSLTRFDQVFHIAHSVEEALQRFPISMIP